MERKVHRERKMGKNKPKNMEDTMNFSLVVEHI
jgi:hypothetical protein